MNDNFKLQITKNDFLNFTQKTNKDHDTIIEMTDFDNKDYNNDRDDKNNTDDTNNTNDSKIDTSDNSYNSDNEEILSKIEKIETDLDNIKIEGEEELDENNKEKPTFDIPKYSMIEYLQDKNKNIQDKQTIYEYYYENLNEI